MSNQQKHLDHEIGRRVNSRSNTVIDLECSHGDRYRFDAQLLPRGWRQYDTDQDAWYFGVWVHIKRREILTYAEGDLCLAQCKTNDDLRRELQSMAEFYGPPPPAFRVINEDGTVVHVYDERPEVM